jgi:uncharacterized membrane protein YqjE
MDLRMLESLKRAIPIVLRHLDGYVDLAERDMAEAKSIAIARAKAFALLGVSAVFAVLFGCVLLIALTWDSEYRVLTVGIIAGAFALVAFGSGLFFARKRNDPFATLKREWREDRALIRSLLARETEEEAPRGSV